MALSLIDLMAQDFEPEKYQDRYREALKELIEAKLEGEEIAISEEEPAPGKVVDLMEALKASVERMQSGKKPGAAAAHKEGATTKGKSGEGKGKNSAGTTKSHTKGKRTTPAKKGRKTKSKRGAA